MEEGRGRFIEIPTARFPHTTFYEELIGWLSMGADITENTFSAIDIVSMATMTFLLLIGIPGNVLVIYIFGCGRKLRRTRFEFLLLILGIIDLISITIVPVTFFYLTVTKFQAWHFGYTACKVIPSLLQISVTISQGVLVLICYQRYSSIVYPFEQKYLSKKRVVQWLIADVGISIVLAVPYQCSFGIEVNEELGTKTCAPQVEKRIDFLLAASTLQIIRDLASASILALLSYRMNHSLTQEIETTTWDRSMMSTKSRKLIKTVVVVFTVLCLPVDALHFTYYVMIATRHYISTEIYQLIIILNTFMNLLQISNAAVNVFIYSKMHVFFRKAIFRGLTNYNMAGRRPPSKTITSLISIDNNRFSGRAVYP